MSEPWAIVLLQVDARATGCDRPTALARLHELAAVLAGAPDVGGVEQRDDERALALYTTPTALDRVVALARTWAERFALSVEIQGEVRTDDDWRDAWKEFYRPILLGNMDSADGAGSNATALVLRPSWIPRKPSDPALEVVLDPGRAFGTGLHETTRLCLDGLAALAAVAGRFANILDLGCGSGILALCAARWFPRAHIVALDDDPEATATTAENAAINGVQLEIVTGDLPSLPIATAFDLVLANIRDETLVPRAGAIADRTRADARVILSGILVDERDDVERAFAAAGFEVLRPGRETDIWCAIDLRRTP
jgi:ribosomal protein L11 methyltransferase